MKRILSTVIAGILLLIPLCAFAVGTEYVGSGFSISIPDGENVLYLTPEKTNMTGDMLKGAQEEPNVVVLTGVYGGGGDLAYTLKLYEQPIADASTRIEELSAQYAQDYTFGEATEDEVAGCSALMMSGDSIKNPEFASRIYVFSYEDKLYTVNLVYRNGQDDQYLNEAIAQLKTLKMGAGASVSTPAPAATLMPTPTPIPVQTPIPTGTALVVEEPSSASVQNATELVVQADPFLLIAVIAAVIVITVLAAALLRVHKKKAWQEQTQKQQRAQEAENEEERPTQQYRRVYDQDKMCGAQRQQMEERPTLSDAAHGDRYLLPEIQDMKTAQILQQIPELSFEEEYDTNVELVKAYELKKKRDYIFAAKKFHEVVRHSDDPMIRKSADMQIIECLIDVKQYHAALLKAIRVFYKDYDYTVEERMRLKSLITILKRK